MLEFRLLGLVEIWSGGRRVPVGQPRQRLVLAALLVDAGRPVTTEVLLGRVWGDSPPNGARHAVHEYLARIRRLLAQLPGTGRAAGDDGPRLDRRGGVYVLEIDPDLVDLHRFRRLIERARDPGCPDPERVTAFGEALELWRGDPLADLSGEWVERVREAARRQRLEAAVGWAQAQVRLGRATEVIEPLSQLAVESPLEEPVTAVLMRSLHAAGRTVEALDCYTAIRKRLVDDLGTEPGAELQAIHQLLLRGEPEPEPEAEAEAQPEIRTAEEHALVAPAQLPVAVRGFVGREEQLARLDALLSETQQRGSTVVIGTVSGTAGVGKTALAVYWAHRVADRFPDGQLYVNLRGFGPSGSTMSTADAMRAFLDGLGVAPQRIPADLADQAAMFRSLLAGKRMLVVLDNAHDADQVRPLLPGSPGCLVLVTSRNALASLVAVNGARPLPLDVLTVEESHRLLAHRLGADRVAAEPEAVTEIIARCARLPLALAVIAARAAVQPALPLTALAQQLGEAHGHLDTLSAGDARSDVRAVFSWSYRALSPAAADVFRLLGLHPGPDISAAAAASLAGTPVAEVSRLLDELTGAHLLTESRFGRYSLHDLLRAYAIELADRVDSDELRQAAAHRVLDHYLHTAQTADQLLNPARDIIPLEPPQPGVTPEVCAEAAEALAWFTAEHQVLLTVAELAASARFDRHTWQLAWLLTTYLYRQGHAEAYVATQRAAVAAAIRLDDPAVRARAHRGLATAYIVRGRLDDAQDQLRQALPLVAMTGDSASAAHTHHSLAYIRQAQSRYAEALEHARQALELFEATENRLWRANALNNVGWLAARVGHHDEAITACRTALALHEQAEDLYGQAAAWDSLGYAHHQRGEYAEARECYRRAIELIGQVGDRYQQAEILDRLGDLHGAAGDQPAAQTAYREALAILDDLGHPDAGRVQRKIGDAA